MEMKRNDILIIKNEKSYLNFKSKQSHHFIMGAFKSTTTNLYKDFIESAKLYPSLQFV